MKNIGVIGAGSWGTAIAILLRNNGHNVTIWSFNKDQALTMIENQQNNEFLPGINFPDNLKITYLEKEAVNDCDLLVLAVPSQFVRQTLERFKPFIKSDQIIVNVSKGFEHDTLLRLSEVINEVLPNNNVCVLSGPSHAEEVSRNIPTTCVSASNDVNVSKYVQDVFMNTNFRVYTSQDVIGVELGGALKNVIALAAGASDGLGFGDNTKAALMTRGLTEIAQLGAKMGANKNTFQGLSGLGDLIVTCTSMHSRNRRAGILIGKGKTLEETLKEVHMVVEGVSNSEAAYNLSLKYDLEMPIITEVYNVLFKNKNPRVAVIDLMTREKKSEDDLSGW